MRKFTILLMLLLASSAQAARIKDVAQVAGVVTTNWSDTAWSLVCRGLASRHLLLIKALTPCCKVSAFNCLPAPSQKPKNVAAVIVTADLPAFSKQGQTIDITVSSIGSAKSLRGGTLMQTFLKGLDGQVYAVAQGNLVVSGFSATGADGSKIVGNNPTVGMISSGAIVEREVPNPFGRGDYITFNLFESDFTTAQRLADAVNQFLGPQMASAVDAASIKVRAPRDLSQRVAFLSAIENLEFNPADSAAKIIVNSRTGTIVVGQNVRLKPAAVTHGGMTVAIKENLNVSQPNALGGGQTVVVPNTEIEVTEKQGKMFKLEPGVTLDDLVRAVNEVGAAPSDLMAILQALKQAGAIEGQLIII